MKIVPRKIPAAKPARPTTAFRSPPARRSTMRSGQPRKASAPIMTNAPSTKRSAGRRTGSGFPFLRGQRHQEAAEHKTDDLRADILDLGSRMQTHSACDVALKARDTEAHVGRVAERRQHECCDADDNTGQNDEQVFLFSCSLSSDIVELSSPKFDILEREYRKRRECGLFHPHSLLLNQNNTLFHDCQSFFYSTFSKNIQNRRNVQCSSAEPCSRSSDRNRRLSAFRTRFLSALHMGAIRLRFAPSPVIR